MTQKGRVIKTDENRATVEVIRMSACESCHKNSEECMICTLGGGRRKINIEVENKCNAGVGDTVMLETDSKTVLLYAAAVFLFPILMAVAANIISVKVFALTGAQPLLFAAAGLILAFVIVYFTVGRQAKKKSGIYMSQIIERESCKKESEDDNT